MGKRKSAASSSGGDNGSSGGGVMMILSPAKTLDLSPLADDDKKTEWTTPECDAKKTQKVAAILRKKKEGELAKLLGISANLAKTAREYWSSFQDDPSERDDLKPAIYAFSGAAYQGLDSNTCSAAAISYLQDNLRIVDPLYGTLRPLDQMQPYRLEMATKNLFSGSDKKVKLADFWRPSVCASLSADLEQRDNNSKILLNLASDEYAAAVDDSLLPKGTLYVKIVFWNEGRTIAIHAKRARGLMCRYLADNAIQDLEGVKSFDLEGYHYVESESNDTTLVFDRKKKQSASGKTAAAKKETTAKGRASSTRKRRRKT